MFDRAMVSRSRALELIDMLIEALPEEIGQAKELLERREELLEEAHQQAGDIVDEAVRKAERLVDADAITAGAREQADRLKAQADGYTAERLEQLERELVRLREEVRAGIRALGTRFDPDSDEGPP